jgi:hypothetical protein
VATIFLSSGLSLGLATHDMSKEKSKFIIIIINAGFG